jgi:hypothetical protein
LRPGDWFSDNGRRPTESVWQQSQASPGMHKAAGPPSSSWWVPALSWHQKEGSLPALSPDMEELRAPFRPPSMPALVLNYFISEKWQGADRSLRLVRGLQSFPEVPGVFFPQLTTLLNLHSCLQEQLSARGTCKAAISECESPLTLALPQTEAFCCQLHHLHTSWFATPSPRLLQLTPVPGWTFSQTQVLRIKKKG